MDAPFTADGFLAVFARYNHAVWPAQLALAGIAAALVLLALRRPGATRRAAPLVLAGLWAWMAIAYHALFFTAINPLAYAFALLFLVQAALFGAAAVPGRGMRLAPRTDLRGVAGALMVVYALVFYPLVGMAAGHAYPAAPTFGLPCPTTIFTFGILLWAEERVVIRLLVIPVLWSLLGISAAVQFGIVQDYGLPIAAAAALVLWGMEAVGQGRGIRRAGGRA